MATHKTATHQIPVQAESHIFDCSSSHTELSKLTESITANPHKQTELFLKQAALAAGRLPKSLHQRLLEFYLHGNETGVLLLSHCPQEPAIDEIPTPTPGLSPQGLSDKQSYISECCLAIVAARLGHIFGYQQINNGELFQNIIPKPGMEHEQSYASSLTELAFHTEQHFHPQTPDYLLLYCLRGSPDAATFFAGIRHATAELDQRSREILFEPLYRSGIDHVFGNTETERGNGPVMPVLYGNKNDPFLRYDQDLMVATTPEAQSALDTLQQALEKSTNSVCLQPGELLIVDNRRAVHGRRPFTAKFNGKDRWLQRTKVIREIDQSASDFDQNRHIIQTDFAHVNCKEAATPEN